MQDWTDPRVAACSSPEAHIELLAGYLQAFWGLASGQRPARAGSDPPEAAARGCRPPHVPDSPLQRLSPRRLLIARDEQVSKRTTVSPRPPGRR